MNYESCNGPYMLLETARVFWCFFFFCYIVASIERAKTAGKSWCRACVDLGTTHNGRTLESQIARKGCPRAHIYMAKFLLFLCGTFTTVTLKISQRRLIKRLCSTRFCGKIIGMWVWTRRRGQV